jgi:quinoprotein glucose dehydrogenase
VALAWGLAARAQSVPGSANEWPTYGHDKGGARYSPLTQITPANVAQLKPAWTYHMRTSSDPNAPRSQGPGGRGAASAGGFRQSEVTPLVIDGVMYITTPWAQIVALDPTSGKEIWTYAASGSTRGLEYWSGDAAHPPQIIFHGNGGLMSLNSKTGQPSPSFGNNGVLSRASMAEHAAAPALGTASGSSPPIVYKNVVISGSANPFGDGRNGDIRGFDVITGKELWRFNTVPQKGEPGYDTWAPGSAEKQTSVHVWGLMTLDADRGIVYAPINAPEWNRYGGNRHGDNLYSTSVVALDALTGKLIWHFQIVHHDIWDMDADAPSTLFDVKKDGRTIPAIGVVSKSALMFILDRTNGKPLYGVEERPVPQSEIPLEKTSPTQPFPLKPPPLGRQTMSRADIAEVSAELYKYCSDLIDKYNIAMGGPYMPPGYNRPSVSFPGTNASLNWGGGAFDPALGYYIVNTQDLGQFTGIGERGQPRQSNGVAGPDSGSNPEIPYAMVGFNGRFKQIDSNMMCQQPPWGQLTAVNVNTGEIAWQVRLGISEWLPADKQRTGRPNSGGPIVTASGLVFIGATDDSRFRAFDAKTGKELWVEKLPAGSHSVPITYLGKDGKQYLVFPSTGGSFLEDPALDDSIRAYRLP